MKIAAEVIAKLVTIMNPAVLGCVNSVVFE
jgi:hypothetical protein